MGLCSFYSILDSETAVITGGCGFVGFNLARRLKERFPEIHLFLLDYNTKPAFDPDLAHLKQLQDNVVILQCDIRNADEVDSSFATAASPTTSNRNHPTSSSSKKRRGRLVVFHLASFGMSGW